MFPNSMLISFSKLMFELFAIGSQRLYRPKESGVISIHDTAEFVAYFGQVIYINYEKEGPGIEP